jgi:hypothetical protein
MVMDCRETLNANQSFLELLKSSFRSKEKIYLLIDDNGMTRREGFIKDIDINASTPFIIMESELKVELNKIVAMNGIFLAEYGEC